MVDNAILARKVAAILDAVARIHDVLPQTADAFVADRTAREVVTFSLFLALQETIALAAQRLADEGVAVPDTYGDVFAALGADGVIDPSLAARLRAATGLRNLVAHQYGVLDFQRVFFVARDETEGLIAFCKELAARADEASR